MKQIILNILHVGINILCLAAVLGVLRCLGPPRTEEQHAAQESYQRAIAPIVQITTANGTQDIKVRGIHRYWNGMVRVVDWDPLGSVTK